MSETRTTGWVGWGWFAAILLIIAGAIDAIYGLIAVLMPGSAYFVAVEGDLFLFDVSGWGWWHIAFGLLFVLIGIALMTGATWARVIAVILAALNGLAQLALLPVQPWWSLIVLTLDILVIYALTVHGKELKKAY